MAIPITIPPLGWSSDDAVFSGWIKHDGDEIRAGDALFTVESDKATQDIESLDAGTLRIPSDGPRAGDKLKVGSIIGYLVDKGEAAPFQSSGKTAVTSTDVAKEAAPRAGPAARRLARELAIDVHAVAGTGKAGCVTAEDIRRHHEQAGTSVKTPTSKSQHPAISPRAKRVARELGIDWSELRGGGASGRIRERDIRAAAVRAPQAPAVPSKSSIPSTIRKTIAARMLASSQNTAPVTLTTTADATNLVNLRKQFQEAGGVVPGYTDLLVKLCACALKEHPYLNARWENEQVQLLDSIHVGIAVDTEAGLLVPVLRDVPRLGLRELATQSRDLAERARERRLKPDEMQGGTFTVTNLGAFGIDAFTPIINAPEAAILGIGRIQRQPVVLGESQIAIQDVVTLSLTFDHRIVDGAPAARFLQRLVEMIKNPAAWLMG
jgi:pyruvate dehydrogenase E2 component (dihydrolipoamide acetyltransferase)